MVGMAAADMAVAVIEAGGVGDVVMVIEDIGAAEAVIITIILGIIHPFYILLLLVVQ
jgi:hypothetical protein